MTMHDDPDLDLLERDLCSLGEPREGDELLRIAVRDRLAARLRPQRTRQRFPVRLAFGVTAVAAAAAITLVALVGTTGSGGPSTADAAIIHRALTAITPPADSILHVKVVGVQNGVPVGGETWQQTSPPYASRGMKGTPGSQGEFSDDGTTSFTYDPSTNTIYEQPDSSPPPPFSDPVSSVRQELATGHAAYSGTVTIDGTTLIKIDLPSGVVGYFDQTNYDPRFLDDPQRDGSVVRLRVVAYEYLPMNGSTRPLLSVAAQHPRAQIVIGPGPGPGSGSGSGSGK